MQTLVIIRTYPVDDYIAYLCYLSFKKVMSCNFIFFAEKGRYKWLTKTNGIFLHRESCVNFGGQLGLNICIDGLSKINVTRYDNIILCDSDITVLRNPLDVKEVVHYEFAGVQDYNNKRHFSGQFLIFSNRVWNKVMKFPNYVWLIESFVKEGIVDVADDTCMSWVATGVTTETYNFHELGYWKHEKNYHLEPK